MEPYTSSGSAPLLQNGSWIKRCLDWLNRLSPRLRLACFCGVGCLLAGSTVGGVYLVSSLNSSPSTHAKTNQHASTPSSGTVSNTPTTPSSSSHASAPT